MRPQTDVGLENLREGFAAMQGPDGKLRGEFISSVLEKLFGTVQKSTTMNELAKIIADAQAAIKKDVAKELSGQDLGGLTRDDRKNIKRTYL